MNRRQKPYGILLLFCAVIRLDSYWSSLHWSFLALVLPCAVARTLSFSLFRHRSLLFLFSRPCRTILIDLFLLAINLSLHFSVQKHQLYKIASMKFLVFNFSLTSSEKSCCIFQEILLLWDETTFKSSFCADFFPPNAATCGCDSQKQDKCRNSRSHKAIYSPIDLVGK